MLDLTKREDTVLEEVLYHGVHESGVQVFVMPKPGYQKCHAMFATRYGSLESEFLKGDARIKIPDGTAHFLEHKLFEEDVYKRQQLLSAKSIMRYWPPNGTAGLATSFVSAPRRLPCPPAKIIATHSVI